MVTNSPSQLTHLTGMSIVVGNNLRPGEWLEFETSSFPAYIQGHNSELQPLGATPKRIYLNGFDGSSSMVLVENNTDTFGGRRRLSGHPHRRLTEGTIQWNEERKTLLIRVEGPPDCYSATPWDPCGGGGGGVNVDYAPPPSPPPPSPPLPPPPPPSPPPSPSPPLPPRSFSAEIAVTLPVVSLGSLTESAFAASVEARALARLSRNESATASFFTVPLVSASVTVAVSGDATDASFQDSVVSAVQGSSVCARSALICTVTVSSAAASRRRLTQTGTVSLAITRVLRRPPRVASDISVSSSLSVRANATLASLGMEVFDALPLSMNASVIIGESSMLSAGVHSVLTALGNDESDLASSMDQIAAQVASDLGVQSVDVVSTISIVHPPAPPPASPPMPAPPPLPQSPPEVPPGAPSAPPIGTWATPYYEDCNATECPDGCFSSEWSSMWTWHGQGLALGANEDDALFVWPRFKSNVTIKQCRTVVLDLDMSVQLYSIVVWGTLRIRDRGPSSYVSLRTVCINIKPGGKVLAGEEDQPYSGVLEFLFTGDALTESAHCGGRKSMQFDINEGAELKLYGNAPTGPLWSRLRTTAEASDRSLTLIGQLDLVVGDEVLIAGTERSEIAAVPGSAPAHSGATPSGSAMEFQTVARVDFLPSAHGGIDTKLTFRRALFYRHFAATEAHGAHELDMRAEVSLYFRPAPAPGPPAYDMLDWGGVPIRRSSLIRISGARSTNPRFRFKTFPAPWGAGMKIDTYAGAETVLHGVFLADGGKFGGGGKAQYFLECSGRCDIRNSVVQPKGGNGIALWKGHVENILMTGHWSGVILGEHTSLFDSAFIGTISTTHDANVIMSACSAKAHRNAIANGQGGFEFTRYCLHEDALANNSVHSCNIGASVFGEIESNTPPPAPSPSAPTSTGGGCSETCNYASDNDCDDGGPGAEFSICSVGTDCTDCGPRSPAPALQRGIVCKGLRMWHVNMGVWLYVEAPDGTDPTLSDLLVADAGIGLVWSLKGPNPETHESVMKRVTISDSVFIGRSFGNPRCGYVRAMTLPISQSDRLGITPGICGTLGGEHLAGIWGRDRSVGSYPTLSAETRVTRTSFLRYTDTCGTAKVLETHQEGTQDSSDGVPPLFFSETTIDAASRANLANLKGPKRSWIVPTKCGVMDCDGPKQVIIHDLDGTLTGRGPDSSILGRSEFMHRVRQDRTQNTWYNIPTKMLYDPAPYVRTDGSRTTLLAGLPMAELSYPLR